MPRDIDVILQTLDTPGWVFLPPSRDRVMQDEVHHDARVEIARRDLPPETPYAGWHTQAAAAGRDGALTRPQRISFGGDRSQVRDRLLALEDHGFAVLGGRTDDEAFLLVRDAHPTAAVADELPALRTRLRLLADPELHRDEPVPLRAGEEDLLHDVLRSPELAAPDAAVRPDALAALHRRGRATTTDVEAVVRGWREVFGDRAPELARVAVDLRHPFAEDLVLDLLADGAAPSDLLAAWGDPRAVEATRERAVRGTRRDVEAYLDLAVSHGATRRDALLTIAEQIRADGPAAGRAAPTRRTSGHTGAGSTPWPTSSRAWSTWTARSSHASSRRCATRRSPRGSARRSSARSRSCRAGSTTGSCAPPGTPPRPFGPSPDQPSPEEARTVLDAWDDAARTAFADAGAPPWPGFGVGSARSRARTHEATTQLDAWQADALRAHLTRTDATETELATCLELLLVTGALRVADLDPLRTGWRRRLFVTPDTYSSARPAVVTFASALLRAGDPLGDEVARVVLADPRGWAAGPRHLVLAETGGPDASARLWAAAMTDGPGSRQAAHGWVTLDARTYGHPVAAAAARGWASVTEPGPLWRRYQLVDAAICHADPDRPVWGATHRTGSVRQVGAALDLAADPAHPAAMRRRALEVATRSSVLGAPTEAEPAAVDVELATRLRARAGALSDELGTAQDRD
ncbi:hypothetical protein [Sanguibacter sp. 25GB23B1]|uniref:hypothetical protein n=1 Tax=unclassified Sanguibacter TaxID=2645534 RepID=UPI0032AEA7BF